MNYFSSISNSVRKTFTMFAIVSLLAASLPIGVLSALADSLHSTASATLDSGAPTYTSGTLDASSYENLVFSFDYDAETLDDGDSFVYGWRQVGGADNDLGSVSGFDEVGTSTTSDEIGSISVGLPSGAQIADLEVYVTATVDSGSDQVNLTNISVTGDVVVAPLEENAVCDSGCEYTSLADAVAGEIAGETITLKNQIHTITSGININKALTIVGEAGSTIQTSGSNIILTITADGVILDSLVIVKTDSVNQNLIQINADNVTVQNGSFSGTYTNGDGQVTRAFEVVGGKTGLLLTGNTITNLRQPAYINNTTSGSITDNHVADTRGWVIVSDTDLTFTGNTWGSNAVDIAIISQSSSANNYTCEIVAGMVSDNNNAVIDNQVQSPACPPEPVEPPTMPSLSGQVIYDAIPSPLPSSVPSLGYQATQTYEFGDKIVFAPLTGRELISAAVTLTSWACGSGEWNLGSCETTLGATFSHPITLNIYEVATDGSVGTLIASKTQSFDIPYRPSADSTCDDVKQWKDTSGDCFNGYNHVVVFDMTGVTVPKSVIYGIEYNTQSYGDSPEGVGGPYNSLNVGLNTDTSAPYIGTDVNDDEVFWNANNSGFIADDEWSPYKIAVAFTAVELPQSEIIQPTDAEVVSGTIELKAFYSDENGDGNDAVQWAVRAGSCSSGTVFGNVDGRSDVFTWDSTNFTASFDTTTVANGSYCFVFNPSEDAGDVNQRLTRQFTIDNAPAAVPTAIFTATPSNTEVSSGGYTQEQYFTFNLTSSSSTNRYQLKYWNDIDGSGFKEATPWNPDNLAPYSSSLGVYNDNFTQGEGTHYFAFSACNSSNECSEYSEPFVVTYDATAPSIPQITAPVAEQIFSTTPILNQWTSSTDNVAVAKHQIAYRYDDAHTFGGTTCPDVTIEGDWVGCRDTTGTSRNHSPSLAEEGGVTIWVRAFDVAGNVSD